MSKIVENEANPRAKASNLRDASSEAKKAGVCEGEQKRAPRANANNPRANASNTVLKQEERDRFIHWISPILEERFGETIRTASNKVAVPIVLENGEEAYIVINVAIPLGEREAKEERLNSASSYNPYIERDNYAMECEIESERMRAKERKEKEKIAAKEKAKNAKRIARETRRKLRENLRREIAGAEKAKEYAREQRMRVDE